MKRSMTECVLATTLMMALVGSSRPLLAGGGGAVAPLRSGQGRISAGPVAHWGGMQTANRSQSALSKVNRASNTTVFNALGSGDASALKAARKSHMSSQSVPQMVANGRPAQNGAAKLSNIGRKPFHGLNQPPAGHNAGSNAGAKGTAAASAANVATNHGAQQAAARRPGLGALPRPNFTAPAPGVGSHQPETGHTASMPVPRPVGRLPHEKSVSGQFPAPAKVVGTIKPDMAAAILARHPGNAGVRNPAPTRTPITNSSVVGVNTLPLHAAAINRGVAISGARRIKPNAYTSRVGGETGDTKKTQANEAGGGISDTPEYSITLPGSHNCVNFDPETGNYEIVDPTTGEIVHTGNMYDENGGKKDMGKIVDPKTGDTLYIDPRDGEYVTYNPAGVSIGGNNFYGTQRDKNPSDVHVITDPYSGNQIIIDTKTGGYTIVDPKTGNTIGSSTNFGGSNGITDPQSGDKVVIDPKTGYFKITKPGDGTILTDGNIYAPQPGQDPNPADVGSNTDPNFGGLGSNADPNFGDSAQAWGDWGTWLASEVLGVSGWGDQGYYDDGMSAGSYVDDSYAGSVDVGAAQVPPAIPANPAPSAANAVANVAIVNPESNGVDINFLVDGEVATLPSGTRIDLAVSQARVIEFDRGGSFGSARYALSDGLYTFTPTDKGWELFRSPYAAPANE